MRWQFLTSPLALAVLVTVANAVKPVTVDDTAYLIYARQFAAHPADPYGFSVFWYAAPEPAMNVLAPPVVPYWLACGYSLFGDHIALLKLWLFPFVLLLAWALRALLVRFARGTEHTALPLLMLSPAVLPTVNLMLDVPAVALALAAVELFIRAAPRGNWWLAALAGLVGGLAMQTKYIAFAAPVAVAWFGLTHRRPGLAALAVGVSVAVFAGWEQWLVQKYGESHFWHHARAAAEPPADGANRLAAFAHDKFTMLILLSGHVGCLAVGVGLLAGSALRVSRRWLAGTAVAWGIGFVLIATLPQRWTVFGEHTRTATAFWQASGVVAFSAVALCAVVLLVRVKRGLGIRANADTWFLAGWLVIEVVAAMGLTPFPAARRVIGVTLVMGLVAARAASRVGRRFPARRPPRWVFAVGIFAGIAVAAVDTFDAFPEKDCAELAAEATRDRPPEATVWYVGHWGFQHYCERAGMQPLIARVTVVRAGDFVVLPVYPDEKFHRPHAGFDVMLPPLWAAEVVDEFVWDDALSAKTVPNFYGGVEPVAGRDHPRLRVRVYRFREDWVMGEWW